MADPDENDDEQKCNGTDPEGRVMSSFSNEE